VERDEAVGREGRSRRRIAAADALRDDELAAPQPFLHLAEERGLGRVDRRALRSELGVRRTIVRPDSCDPAASALVTEAVHTHRHDDMAALMMACQVLRRASMIAARSPDSAAKACGRMVAALDRWLR
jgi:hypothetical protein